MANALRRFENFARLAHRVSDQPNEATQSLHPFELRNIETSLPSKVRNLFDNGHYAEATFEAFKFLDKLVAKKSGISKSGEALMMDAFKEDNPAICLSAFSGTSGKDEQRGYRFLFAGGIVGIRNPRGHEHSIIDSPDVCLDHLVFASMLARKVKEQPRRVDQA